MSRRKKTGAGDGPKLVVVPPDSPATPPALEEELTPEQPAETVRSHRVAPKVGAAPDSDLIESMLEQFDAPELAQLIGKNPRMPLFVASLTLNGGDASNAAVACGWTPQYGRMLLVKHPVLRDIIAEAARQVAESAMVGWRDMHQEALRTIRRCLNSPDDKVALHAALKIVERVEGKVPSRLHATLEERKVSVATVTIRFVASLHMLRGMPVAEAFEYAQRHPEQVEQWAQLQLAAGQPPDAAPAGSA